MAQGVQPLADSAIAGSDRLFELAVLDAPTASLVASTLSPLFAVGTLLFIIRRAGGVCLLATSSAVLEQAFLETARLFCS